MHKRILSVLLLVGFAINLFCESESFAQEETINQLTSTAIELKEYTSLVKATSETASIDYTDNITNINNLLTMISACESSKEDQNTYNYSSEIASVNNIFAQEETIEETVVVQETVPLEDPNVGILAEKEQRESVGRLTIPDVGINVALFNSGVYDANAQRIVDNYDSAALLSDVDFPIIADHTDQGFCGIKNAVVGQSVAYINYGDHTESYTCVKKCLGTNDGNYLWDDEGRSIYYFQQDYIQYMPYIIMYTCNEDKYHITITIWSKN